MLQTASALKAVQHIIHKSFGLKYGYRVCNLLSKRFTTDKCISIKRLILRYFLVSLKRHIFGSECNENLIIKQQVYQTINYSFSILAKVSNFISLSILFQG